MNIKVKELSPEEIEFKKQYKELKNKVDARVAQDAEMLKLSNPTAAQIARNIKFKSKNKP